MGAQLLGGDNSSYYQCADVSKRMGVNSQKVVILGRIRSKDSTYVRVGGWTSAYVIDYHECAGTYRGRFHHAETTKNIFTINSPLARNDCCNV
jgi:hypothetical protein